MGETLFGGLDYDGGDATDDAEEKLDWFEIAEEYEIENGAQAAEGGVVRLAYLGGQAPRRSLEEPPATGITELERGWTAHITVGFWFWELAGEVWVWK